MRKAIIRVALASALACGLTGQAWADAASSVSNGRINEGSGAQVYQHVCQGCHMQNGKGALGAAAIPAFAGNQKLATSGYPVYVVLNGLGGMPWFNGALSDAQVASVVNYIRTHFGNNYTDSVSPADVAAVRGPAPTMEH